MEDLNKAVADGMLARKYWGQYPVTEIHMVRAVYLSVGRPSNCVLTNTLWGYWQNPDERDEEQTDAV